MWKAKKERLSYCMLRIGASERGHFMQLKIN